MQRFVEARDKFFAALDRFEDLLARPRETEYFLDAAIQRFEFTYEMAWRAMKHAAEWQGLTALSPRQAMAAAQTLGLIDDDGVWIALMRERNETAHTYKESAAEAMFSRLPAHQQVFQALRARLAAFSAGERPLSS